MLSPISKAVAVLAVGVPLVHAINSFQFPSVVTAGKPTTLTINNDMGPGTEPGDDTFRVSLVITSPGLSDSENSEAGPVCWLVNSTASDTTTLSITIPADVGPSGPYYSLAITDVTADGDTNYIFTDGGDFNLEGGTAKWSPAELQGTAFGDDTIVPCTSYNCVRNCTLLVDFDNLQNISAEAAEAETKAGYECMAACPGIHVPSWNETYGGEAFGDSDDSSSSSSSSSSPSALASGGPSAPTTTSTKATAAVSSSPSKSTSTSAPTSGTSNSTVSTQQPNSAIQIAAGIPILLSFAAGILLM
ncbi:hypothetical protein B7463_g848, partial [Scytalidium lignicola]